MTKDQLFDDISAQFCFYFGFTNRHVTNAQHIFKSDSQLAHPNLSNKPFGSLNSNVCGPTPRLI